MATSMMETNRGHHNGYLGLLSEAVAGEDNCTRVAASGLELQPTQSPAQARRQTVAAAPYPLDSHKTSPSNAPSRWLRWKSGFAKSPWS
jgi:hypothetical protein